MSYKYNQKFAYSTFEEEAVALNRPVRCLTFQGADAYEEIMNKGVYRPTLDKSRRVNKHWYENIIEEQGYHPVWVFNPLQFGTEPQTTWDPEWFVDGSLWRSFLEICGLSEEIINDRLLLEIEVPSTDLKRDVTLDYGFISCLREIRKESIVAVYRLVYTDLEQETNDDWFYPTIYPSRTNDERATFTKITDFRESGNLLDDIVEDLLSDIDPVSLKTGIEDLYRRVHNLLESIPLRKKRRAEDFMDDVRYAIYNHETEGWIALCVQDFDFKDYDPKRFLIDDCPCGSLESDAVAIFRQRIFAYFAVDVRSADAIACEIAEEICKCL